MQALISYVMCKISYFQRLTALFAIVVTMGCFCGCSDDNKPDKGPDPGPENPDPTPELVTVLTNSIAERTFFLHEESVDNYYMALYCGQVEIYTSSEGSTWIPADEESRVLYLDLYAAPGGGGNNDGQIVLPEGTYTVADNQNPGSAYLNYTYGLWYFDGTIDYVDPTDGTVTGIHTDDGYQIDIEFDMVRSTTFESLGTVNFTYEGPLSFTGQDPAPAPDTEYPVLTETIDATFVGADVKYLGIPAYSSPVDVYVLDLYDDPTPLPDGTLDEGNVLRLELYTEHQGYYPNESNLKMPAGTYEMTDGYVPAAVGIGTGDLWDSGYGSFPYGSYMRHLDEATDKVFYGFLGEGGNVTVEAADDGTYTITANLKTREGVEIKGSYTGKIEIINEAQEPERQTQSRIYEDKVLDLSNTTSADVTFEGTSKNSSTHFYSIFAQDPVSLQGFQLELLAPAGEIGEIAGTYKPSEVLIPLKMTPYTYIPGDIQLVTGGAAMIGTWGYYETNSDGRAVAFAPALTGDIIVAQHESEEGETIYTIDYVLTDDNLEEPHTMTAKFEGTFDISDSNETTTAASVTAASSSNKPALASRVASRKMGAVTTYQKNSR